MDAALWIKRLTSFRLGRTALIGIVASIANLAVLGALVSWLGMDPKTAIIPALATGSAINFLGNRYFVFNPTNGQFGGQAWRFAATEVSGMVLNTLVYRALISWTSINYALAQPLGTFLVFACWSYPIWGLIFRPKATSAPASPGT